MKQGLPGFSNQNIMLHHPPVWSCVIFYIVLLYFSWTWIACMGWCFEVFKVLKVDANADNVVMRYNLAFAIIMKNLIMHTYLSIICIIFIHTIHTYSIFIVLVHNVMCGYFFMWFLFNFPPIFINLTGDDKV
jgi:hypothetical protein